MNCQKLLDKMQDSDQGGYVLLEALLGIVVFAISMAGLAVMLSGSNKATNISREITEQTTIGGNVMEDIIAQPYDDPALNSGPTTMTLGGIPSKYTVSYWVGQDTYLRNTKIVSLTVTNTDTGDWDRTTTISYIIPDTP